MNLNLIALFSLGAFFSFLSYLVTTLEDNGINKQNYKAVLLVLLLKSSLGGFIFLILFHGLDYFFHGMNESLRVGIAGAGAGVPGNVTNKPGGSWKVVVYYYVME